MATPRKDKKTQLKVTKSTGKPDQRVGNKFWEARSSHGRKAIFRTPKKLLESAAEYFQWCEENPFMKAVPHVVSMGQGAGSSVELTDIPVKRPYSLIGFCLFCGVNTEYWSHFKQTLTAKKKGFAPIIKDIEETIRKQQIEGAQSGFFKENITARILGLADKQQIEGDIVTRVTGMEIK